MGRLEAAHYTLCFLFDLLQFSFQYLVKVDRVYVGDSAGEEVKDPKVRAIDPSGQLSREKDF